MPISPVRRIRARLFKRPRQWFSRDLLGRRSSCHARKHGRSSKRWLRPVLVPGCQCTSPRWKKVGLLVLVNLVLFAVTGVIGEVGFQLFWNPKYYIHCDQWAVSSGMTAAGQVFGGIRPIRSRVQSFASRSGPTPRGTGPVRGRPGREGLIGSRLWATGFPGVQVDYDGTPCAHKSADWPAPFRGARWSAGRTMAWPRRTSSSTGTGSLTTSCGPLRPMRWSCASSPGMTSPASCRITGSMPMAVLGASKTRNRAGSSTSRRG